MRIEIFGTGCAKCKRLTKNVERALKEMGAQAELIKVENVDDIISRGVLMTPALAVEGELRASGRVPPVDEIKDMLLG